MNFISRKKNLLLIVFLVLLIISLQGCGDVKINSDDAKKLKILAIGSKEELKEMLKNEDCGYFDFEHNSYKRYSEKEINRDIEEFIKEREALKHKAKNFFGGK